MPLNPAIQLLADIDRLMVDVDKDNLHPRDRIRIVLHLARELGLDDNHNDYDSSAHLALYGLVEDDIVRWGHEDHPPVLGDY
jgi:hypothetical protein